MKSLHKKFTHVAQLLTCLLLFSGSSFSQTAYHTYVDPFIGTEDDGNVVIGPSCPFGMIKPGPDYSLSSQRIQEIIKTKFNPSRKGIPGNDDSGAMSSWLAFHMIGLYPNAGQSYYLINSPFVKETTIRLAGGNTFTIVAKNRSEKNAYIQSAKLNGKPYPLSWIEHSDLTKGGTLELEMGEKTSDWGSSILPPSMSKN